MTVRLMDMFSGIGGFALGLSRAGMTPTSFCEIDPFCRRVLAKHWPDVPCHDDVTTREFVEGEADVICGGFPCQDLSGAGKRAGLSGTRSGLYRELVRAIRVVRPRVAILENVAALLSGPSDDPGGWFHEVLGDLAEGGSCIEWDSVQAAAVGAPHERERVWIVAHADDSRFGLEPVDEQMAGASEDGGVGASAPDASREPLGARGQPRGHLGVEPSAPDPARLRRGQGRPRRPPDSFARIRDEARRNSADPAGARLAFREGFTRDAWEKLTPAERDGFGNERQSIWPDEPALSPLDDGVPDWMARVKATGNAVVTLIPQLIGEAIMKDIPCA